MLVSVVVPAFNEEKLLVRSLRAIKQSCKAFEDRGWAWEVVVCDNNSTDRTSEIAEGEGAKVVIEPVNQISRARNKGASVASGEWLIFVDADSFPSKELFAATAKRIESGQVGGGGCLVNLDEEIATLKFAVLVWSALSIIFRWAAGSFLFCRADLFQETGGFSTEIYASEEIDLSKKLKGVSKKRGLKFEIIREEKLVTSARKVHLYGHRTHLLFLLKAALRPRATVMDREKCVLWYDGRR
ncbi:MAG TPA: glycosyltransferase [Verrucomicrobiae bacterium]